MLLKLTNMGKYMFLLTSESPEEANRVLNERKVFPHNCLIVLLKLSSGQVTMSVQLEAQRTNRSDYKMQVQQTTILEIDSQVYI